MFPKIRIYKLSRTLRGKTLQWNYQGSTTHFRTKQDALDAWISRNRVDPKLLRAEFAATHGYHIEYEG